MAYDPGAIDATLAAAVGDDPALIAELRQAFLDSARTNLTAMERARDHAVWKDGSLRLKGLAASFGAIRLMALAGEATEQPGNPEALRKLKRAVERL
jgi:HPt (histidine-containing phosphotransfer) domain-containing protein